MKPRPGDPRAGLELQCALLISPLLCAWSALRPWALLSLLCPAICSRPSLLGFSASSAPNAHLVSLPARWPGDAPGTRRGAHGPLAVRPISGVPRPISPDPSTSETLASYVLSVSWLSQAGKSAQSLPLGVGWKWKLTIFFFLKSTTCLF